MSYGDQRREPTFSGAMHKLSKEVTNVSKKLASDDTYRTVKDKAQAAMAQDTVGKAVIKATSHEHGPPKEKHVQTLLSAVKDPTTNMPELLAGLFQRIHDKDATVVLKGLMVFHRLFRDSPPSARIYSKVLPNINEFRIGSKFLDDSSHESMQASQMVRTYALYMEEKLCALRVTRFEYDKASTELTSRINTLKPSDLMADLKAVIPQLEAGYKCTIREQSVIHPTAVAAFSLIFKDIRVLYQTLNKGVLSLLENYFSTSKPEASKILSLYKEYLTQTRKVGGIFNDAKELLGQSPIELNTPPESFQRSLEQYLEADDDEPMPSRAQQEEAWQKVPVVPLEDLIGDFGDLDVEQQQKTTTGDPTLDDFFATLDEPPKAAPKQAAPAASPPFRTQSAPAAKSNGEIDVFGSLDSAFEPNPFADPNPFASAAPAG
eukprot:CAMPEP_0206254938 /NCGR_PEP_ID=MMETSP0047_2-20121206/23965_1 /ASSEMBLY_ACC=CAM_ASM_000192 /TAXON_ID=195065 /ORGANISM="Chroomonas mesostigmatica_cf, Strain CCMP1168" /LENGTH=432 /DNA_ID=CAMNT_0053681273 /DNA_START=26 /DNA_END=1320 /DNA_ORIENTATION=-